MADRMLQFFKYDHLPEKLQASSKPFGDLAQWIVDNLPENAERTVALRKLLEAKDAGVRTTLDVSKDQDNRYCFHGEPLGQDGCYQTGPDEEDD